MQNLEAVKTLISTTELLQSVVRTMKTLAAVSIRQQEKAIRDLEEYCRTLDLGLTVLLNRQLRQIVEEPPTRDGNLGIVILGSDQGLCGRFNEQIASFAREQMQALQPDQSRRLVLCAGDRARAHLAESGETVDEIVSSPVSVQGILSAVNAILFVIENWRSRKALSGLVVCYSRMSPGNICTPDIIRLIPFDRDRLVKLGQKRWDGPTIPMFTMDTARLFAHLMRHSLFASLYRAVAESMAAENASRLASMQAAEKNISERLDELNLDYRNLRQGAITEELLDIVAGYEAMTSQRKAKHRRPEKVLS